MKSQNVFLFLLFLLFATVSGNAQNHVSVSSEVTNIYVEPNESSLQISTKKGDTFKTIEFWDGWVQINMFTGAERFLKRSEVELVDEIVPYPADPSVRSEICETINMEAVTNTASEKAMSKYPDDVKQQGIYEQLLVDKFILDTYRKFEIPASHYSKLMECVQDDIRGPVIKF